MPFMAPEQIWFRSFGSFGSEKAGSATVKSQGFADDDCVMIKRRDWVHLHGQDADDSSDDDSSGQSTVFPPSWVSPSCIDILI